MNPINFEAQNYLGTKIQTAKTWGAKPLNLKVDVVIVGAGPGGLTTAAVLGEAGLSVVVVEAGHFWPKGSFNRRQSWALKNLYQDRGTRIMHGNAFVPLASGAGVGGGTLVNSGISFRTPDRILDAWEAQGLEHWRDRDALYTEVEQMIGVQPTRAAVAGMNSEIARRGFSKMQGIKHDYMPRNTPGCVGCGTCQTGCPSNGKASSDVNWLPRALKTDVRIFADARVDEIQVQDKRATGVSGQIVHPETGESSAFEIKADKVILAAGAVNTALLLLRQGLANSSDQVGRNLFVHPGCGALAVFEEEINIFSGASQGYYAEHPTDPDVLGETFSAPPEAFFSQVGRAGPESANFLAQMRHMASCGFLIRDESGGRVSLDGSGGLKLTYNFKDKDLRKFVRGAKFVTEMFFLAGSREVRPLLRGGKFFNSWNEARQWISGASIGDFMLYASHPMGTCRMGADPKRSVVRPDGRTHDIEGLYITDSSLHPSALGVNPQMTIMAHSLALGRKIANS